jgi:hypothetical protein
MSSNKEIAETIAQQLGGIRRLMLMCGAKDFLAIENGLTFRIGQNEKRVTHVQIKLNGSDLYDLEFLRIVKPPMNTTKPDRSDYLEAKPIRREVLSTSEDVYNDSLMDVFENHTGLYLTLRKRS